MSVHREINKYLQNILIRRNQFKLYWIGNGSGDNIYNIL